MLEISLFLSSGQICPLFPDVHAVVEIVDIEDNLSVYQFSMLLHRGQNSKQIIIAKYVSKFLLYGANTDKCSKSQKNFFVHFPFMQSQAK